MMDETVPTSMPQEMIPSQFEPRLLTDFVGQYSGILQLGLELQACVAEKRMPRHILAHGPAGIGKTILGRVLARTWMVPCVQNVGAEFDSDKRAREIMHMVLDKYGTYPIVWLIDEIDVMRYGAATTFHNLMTSSTDNSGRGYFIENGGQVFMPPLTIYGTTNFKANMPRALKSRFPIDLPFQYYTVEELTQIAQTNIERLKMTVSDPEVLGLLASNAGGEPRKLINLLRTAKLLGLELTPENVQDTMTMLEYSSGGLHKTQVEILRFLSAQPKQTAGVDTIAGYLGEDTVNIKGELERFLIRSGLIAVTRGGRQLTPKGATYLQGLTA